MALNATVDKESAPFAQSAGRLSAALGCLGCDERDDVATCLASGQQSESGEDKADRSHAGLR
jgi:hypothetical protein